MVTFTLDTPLRHRSDTADFSHMKGDETERISEYKISNVTVGDGNDGS